MPVKRRNHGRNKKNRGHVKAIPCINCGRQVPKDKAVKRYMIKEIVDASSKRDLYQALDNQEYQIPKLRIKYQYCISCAIHSRIVRVRSSEDRKIRDPPVRQLPKQETKKQ